MAAPTVPGSCALRAPRAGGAAGFSLMEVLIVLGIIGMLALLATAGVQIWARMGPKHKTATTVTKVRALTDAWKQRFEMLPPSDLRRLPGVAGTGGVIPTLPNETNAGIEALFQALYWPGFGTTVSLDDGEVSNTDADELDKQVTGQGPGLHEICDNWGNPLIYFVHTEYAKAYATPHLYLRADGTLVSAKPWRYDDDSRGFAEPSGFQIFSMGEDQEPNTEDDIKSW